MEVAEEVRPATALDPAAAGTGEPTRTRGLLVIDIRRWRHVIPWLWAIAVTAYLGVDRWEHFKNEELVRAAMAAQTDAVLRIVGEASKCQPFDVGAGDKRATLIGMSCLKTAPTPGGGLETQR